MSAPAEPMLTYMRDRAQKFRNECREGSAAWLLAGDVLVLLREIERLSAVGTL